MTADLLGRRVGLIAALGSITAALAAKTATTNIPIVFMIGSDPIRAGLVASLNRPGGNITGVTALNVELGTKLLGLLHELMPRATRFALLANPDNPAAQPVVTDARAAAEAIGRPLEIVSARTNREINAAVADAAQKRADALLISPDQLFSSRLVLLATLTARHAMPAIYTIREFADAGGLMSYGSNFTELYHDAGIYTGKILKGQNPAELPILQAVKFEFVINLQTAAVLGLDIPPTLLARADEVIE